MKKITSVFISLSALALVVTGCAANNSTGKPVAIPPVTMICSASSCLTNGSMYSVMYITALPCEESSIELSVAASSSEAVSCNSATGCAATFGHWVDNSGAPTTTVPSNTYYLCGIVAPSTFAGPWAGHVVAVGQESGKKIDNTTTSLSLSTYVIGNSF